MTLHQPVFVLLTGGGRIKINVLLEEELFDETSNEFLVKVGSDCATVSFDID